MFKPINHGAFTPLFQADNLYLELLDLTGDGAASAMDLIRGCCASPGAAADAEQLLTSIDWRPSLAGVVAALFLPRSAKLLELLWQRLDSQSFITPQIAVGLSILDPDFIGKCRSRLEAHCPVDSSGIRAMLGKVSRPIPGPQIPPRRSAKAATSLAWLMEQIEPDADWLKSITASSEHRSLVSADEGQSARITRLWQERITSLM